MATNIGSLDGPTVLDVSVPASGGTDAGTFKAEFEVDPDVDYTFWPWPAAWGRTASE